MSNYAEVYYAIKARAPQVAPPKAPRTSISRKVRDLSAQLRNLTPEQLKLLTDALQ